MMGMVGGGSGGAMGGMMGGMGGTLGGGGGGGGCQVPCGDNEMAGEVRAFCEKWSLEGRHESRLMDQLCKRGDNWREDIASLNITLADARVPAALLSVKLREMEDGTFVPKGGGKADRGGDRVGDCGGGGKGKERDSGGRGGGSSGGSGLSSQQQDDIQELCDRFSLDDRLQGRLADAMSKRENTFSEDIRSLGEILAGARNPPGLLSVKLREMEDGTFVTKGGGKGKDRDFGGGGRDFGGGSGKGGGIMSEDRKRQLFGSISRSRSRKKDRSRSRRRKGSRDKTRRSNSRRSRSRKKDKEKDRDKDRDKKEKDRDRDRRRDKEKDKDSDKEEERERRSPNHSA